VKAPVPVQARFKQPIVIGIPGYGWKDDEFVLNLLEQAPPIHTQILWYFLKDLEVGDARNAVVEFALEAEASHVLFRDHDVLGPSNGLNILLRRDTDVIGGMYCSKQKPPNPLIIKDGAVTMDWKFGDVVKCDAIGMGFTLINTDIFRKMEPPWFYTKSGQEEDSVASYCYRSEDVYFCYRMIDELGIYPYCDTSVNCYHYNVHTRALFYYDTALEMPVWKETPDGEVMGVAAVTHTKCRVVDLAARGANKEEEVLADGQEVDGGSSDSGDTVGADTGAGCVDDHHTPHERTG